MKFWAVETNWRTGKPTRAIIDVCKAKVVCLYHDGSGEPPQANADVCVAKVVCLYHDGEI